MKLKIPCGHYKIERYLDTNPLNERIVISTDSFTIRYGFFNFFLDYPDPANDALRFAETKKDWFQFLWKDSKPSDVKHLPQDTSSYFFSVAKDSSFTKYFSYKLRNGMASVEIINFQSNSTGINGWTENEAAKFIIEQYQN